MLKRIRAYFSTKQKKEAIAKLIEIKSRFYNANPEYSRNLNELYNVLRNTQVAVPDDISVLRTVDIRTMFKTSYTACELVLDVVDKGVNVSSLMYQGDYLIKITPYLDWQVNVYSVGELLKLYQNFIHLFYLHRANKDELLSLDETKIYNRLTFEQVDFLKSGTAIKLRDEIIDFYVLLLQIELGMRT